MNMHFSITGCGDYEETGRSLDILYRSNEDDRVVIRLYKPNEHGGLDTISFAASLGYLKHVIGILETSQNFTKKKAK